MVYLPLLVVTVGFGVWLFRAGGEMERVQTQLAAAQDAITRMDAEGTRHEVDTEKQIVGMDRDVKHIREKMDDMQAMQMQILTEIRKQGDGQ